MFNFIIIMLCSLDAGTNFTYQLKFQYYAEVSRINNYCVMCESDFGTYTSVFVPCSLQMYYSYVTMLITCIYSGLRSANPHINSTFPQLH